VLKQEPVGGGRWQGEEVRRLIPYKMCKHVCKCKIMIPVETIPGIRVVEGLKRMNIPYFKYNIFNAL
jgi:hypothetical protein